MIGIFNREVLPVHTLEALESLASQFRALFLEEHNEDGTHRAETRELALTPVGSMVDWPTATAPQGWKICDGSQVSRVTYQELFELIGTTFGAGDGSTTFNLPDARGKFALSKAAAGTGSSIGATGGSLDHTHTGPSHTHSISASGTHTHSTPNHSHAAGTLAGPSHTHTMAHTHTYSGTTTVGSDEQEETSGAVSPFDMQTFDHTHDFSGTTSASSAANTGSGGTGSVTGSTASDGSGTSGAGGDHSHGGTTGADGAGNTGSANPAFIVLGNTIIYTGVAA